MITTLKKSPLSCPTRARAPLSALVVAALLLAAVPAPAEPVPNHGSLLLYNSFVVHDPFSFTTDGVVDFSGSSNASSNDVTFNRVNAARWGRLASGHLELTLTSQSEQDFNYGLFGSPRAQTQVYHGNVELIHGFDERFETFGLTDIYQWRFHYVFDFDFEIRWHLTTRGIEPKIRTILGPGYTTAYFCQKLIRLQGGCATTSQPGDFDLIGTRLNFAEIRRAEGSGDWMLDVQFTRTAGVGHVTAKLSFPLLGNQKEVPRGRISVSLENETPCCAKTSIDEARITLIRQSDYLRTQRPGEADVDYQNYLNARTSFPVDSRDIVLGTDSVVTFNSVPLFGLGRRGPATPLWYAVKITSAQTEEIDINQNPVDPNITATTFFIPELNTNLLPSQTVPPPIHNFLITPTDAIGAKLNIIADMTDAKAPCAAQYKAAEDTMKASLDAYVASPGMITPANIEGVKRALWAERVVRAGADYTDQALDVVLGGLATVLGDLFDDVDATDFKRADLKKRAGELEAMGQRAGFKPVAFYTDIGLNKKEVVEAMALDTTLANGQVADFAKGTLKVFKQTMIDSCIQAGINPDDCERDIGRITLAFISILNGISTQTLAGTAKTGIKTFIEFLVKAAKGPIFDGYCSNTASDLRTAVTSGLGWSAFSDSAYRDDARKVSDLLRELSSAATVIGNAQALQIAADGLDRTGDALDVVAIVGKPAKVVAEIVKFTKYVVNLEAIAAAMTLVVRTPFDVQEGTLAAFGQSLPLLRAAESAPATAALHARGGTEVSALAARATNLKAAEFAIRQALGNDDIPAAIQAAADTSDPDAYVNHLAAWTLEIERFKAIVTATRATGSMGSLLSSFALADAELKLAHAEFLASLRELLVAVDTVTYPSPTSRDYLVHRDSIVSQLFLIRNKIDGFIDAVSSLDSAMAGQPVTPFIFSHVTSLASLTTSAEMITQSPEEFELTVQLGNMSTTALNNVTARLVIDSPKDSMTMTTPNDVVIGTLAGGATTTAAWRFNYSGDLSDELIGLRVELLENDTTPTSFDFS